ncbi:MAG: cobyrinate a,c-diamide synthase [Gammaproteobacteria bacterium]|nr:cobyrinate a,c-diamide synthase [Gammaproteobacteria bacterium]
MTPRGIIIAAPGSSSGKTTVTLGLLRLLKRLGYRAGSAKVGPDYVDPGFHEAASGEPCLNLDLWAMRPDTFADAVARAEGAHDVVVAEGVMGLFDGATIDTGSTADVAAATGWPVVLVVDAGGMASSAAAVVHGFATFRSDVTVAGVIYNRCGSARHEAILREATAALNIPVIGALPRSDTMMLPSRHLGLVLAQEHQELHDFLEGVADVLESHIDVESLLSLAAPGRVQPRLVDAPIPMLGQRIAIARDLAFAFVYPLTIDAWRMSGASTTFFSPLNNEPPDPTADAVFLPGGYPELHAGTLAGNHKFWNGLRRAAQQGACVYAECGGYMALGETLIDAQGEAHRMAGLLPVSTTFAQRKLTLGYRDAVLVGDSKLGERGDQFRGHEFHFSQIEGSLGAAEALFECSDARGNAMGSFGQRRNNVMGSFVHLIDRVALP